MEVKMPENAGVFSESESAGVFRILTWSEEDFESSVPYRYRTLNTHNLRIEFRIFSF